jgi:hypothetical protein
MKIYSVSIHNFRGIHDASWNLFDYNLLVGPNNAGKSTIIDAIRAFYEKDGFKFKEERDFPFIKDSIDRESWVELLFCLSDAEDASLAQDYRQPDKILKVKKFLKSDDKKKDGYIFGYKSDGSLLSDPFYGAKNVQSGKFGDIVFIPAVSKVDEHTKLSGPSALRDLLTNVLEAVVASSESYSKLENDFKGFSEGIKTEKTADGRSLTGFEADLSSLLESWGADFQIKLKSPSVAEIIKTLLSFHCIDRAHGKPLLVEQFGSGFQRHFIYSLIQIGAKYIKKSPSKKAKDFTPSMLLILFEEPEAFLHPPQQEMLAENLKKIADAADHQVICSTHSSHFISRKADDIPSIARLLRDSGCISIYQINTEKWIEIVNANQEISTIAIKWPKLAKIIHKDDLKPEMEAIKYLLWLNPDRCCMFFANNVLIVEGPTEQAFINKLMGDGLIERPADGLYVLDGMGKYNIHRFMNLLSHLGIPHSVIHDDDKDANEHSDLNHLIRDSRNPTFTKEIVALPGNLEEFLDVSKPIASHRKPQHLLYLYESKEINDAKLKEFCNLVKDTLLKVSKPLEEVKS